MTQVDRPQRGLAPEAALKRWSDDAKLFAAMNEFSDAWQSCSMAKGHPPSPQVLRHQEYVWRRKILEEAFLTKLQVGVLIASGRLEGSSIRVPIDPDQWDELEIDYMFERIDGLGLTYQKPEFFDPSAIPLNIRYIPEWLTALVPSGAINIGAPKLVHSADYINVAVGDIKFTFGDIQARIVKRLHAERLEGDGWCVGKNVMKDAGSRQSKLLELFKHTPNHDELIESNRRGKYRLKVR